MAARASCTSRSSSRANASQSFILSGLSRWSSIARSGTMLQSASVAARCTSSCSENCRYSSAPIPFSVATRRRAVRPSESKLVSPSRHSKWHKSDALSWRHAHSSGRMPTRRCASVRRFGSVVTRILPEACAAKTRALSDAPEFASASATHALKPPCCTSVPRKDSSVARAQNVSASFSAVLGDGFVDARRANATTPSATHNFRARARARSGVSPSASSSAFCLVMRWNSSYCSGVISISRSRKWRRRSSSFVTVRFAKSSARPYATGSEPRAAFPRPQSASKAAPVRPEPCASSSFAEE
mmetsp:Transcript_1374/g.4103  ORF Transcript_1374/g.4103 Transcript_1374/m.4103 type:complete len:300 (+) Transcript_1374:176-1075(+)